MPDSPDYKIQKIEKGPLQRFKNQNLLIKKFGEVGLQVYKAITGKRTSHELKKDLGIEAALFDQIISFMHDVGMVELEPVKGKKAPVPETKEVEIEEPEEPVTPARKLEDISPEEQLEIEPDIQPLQDEPKPQKKKKPKVEETEEKTEIEGIEVSGPGEEIHPISESEDIPEQPEEKVEESEEIEPEEKPEETNESEEITITAFEETKEPISSEPELSPVEKIISDKYGDIGLRVYALIDGQRTAEEIMRETGLTEPKLVEILDFMDEQGIIKLDYPKGSGPSSSQTKSAFGPGPSTTTQQVSTPQTSQAESGGFRPIFDTNPDEAQAIPSPVEIPIKAPLDIIKSVQGKAKLLLKYGDKGTKISEQLNGKNDVIDLALKLDTPLYEVAEILRFMLENGMLIVKAVSRADVRKKYGDDGYSVYKVYGKEGLMLYELIGKELTIKQMADKITKDKSKIVDMFVFIHRVLGIELPIDKEVLQKQLGT
ncbi:Uncharacterised protein [Candidatus Bilamarchaeum dharawalense]|uniref:Uncharacterized protein n=1 Tax=Candidatus Bilamarchaeum dharawalense TaxID=2885759 RepID=A0A5E4LQ27_9ARCH|nr:Uncharacterised protein [Candidatus Bilamarchaeum dharawalense]